MLPFNNSWTLNVGSLDFYFLIALCLAPEHHLTLLPVCRHVLFFFFGRFYEFAQSSVHSYHSLQHQSSENIIASWHYEALEAKQVLQKVNCGPLSWVQTGGGSCDAGKKAGLNQYGCKKKKNKSGHDCGRTTGCDQVNKNTWLACVLLCCRSTSHHITTQHITSHHNRVTWGQIPVGSESLWRQRSL